MDPHDTAEATDEVYRIYGNVMHVVQDWELALAVLWWWATSPPADTGEAESKASSKAVQRLETAFKRVTASQARRDLGDGLPADVVDAIGDLLPIRNRLAHSFLREQQRHHSFAPGTLAWLGNAGARFDASIRSLARQMESLGSHSGPVPAHWPDLAQTVLERLFAGKPADFDAELRESSDTA